MKHLKKTAIALAVVILVLTAAVFVGNVNVHAAPEAAGETVSTQQDAEVDAAAAAVGPKAIAAALAIGLAAAAGAIAMGMAISKSNEGIARQPEAADSIRALLMLGLVFIETVVIYALIVAILIVFVM
ncbi:MAG: ATP synthase F0 subunit C [Lachnospiraceae bacterium]|nr:ATP synthase F0 subunit C [Lachnospiraceae bacterium]